MTGIDLIKARAFGAGGGSGGSGGGSAQLDALIDRSITEVRSNAENVGTYAFYKCESLKTIDFPNARTIDKLAFSYCYALTDANFPSVTLLNESAIGDCTALINIKVPNVVTVGVRTFNSCESLEKIDLHKVTSIKEYAFVNCGNLKAMIIRTSEQCTLGSTTAFNNTPIKSGTGYIYVPSALVGTYKAATNWSTYARQFRALEDYTVDGTIYGEMDWAKMAA